MKILLKMIVIVFFIVVLFFNSELNKNKNLETNLLLENIEALANGENEKRQYSCWHSVSSWDPNGGNADWTHVTYCGSCGPIECRSWSTQSTCVK